MRTMKRLGQVLILAALLVIPVVAISAQSGTTGGGYEWDGASDWPGVTSIIVPEALPETGADPAGLTEFEWQLRLNEMIAGGVSPDSASPSALPQTGASPAEPPFHLALPPFLNPEISSPGAPEALPQTGVDISGLASRDRQVIEDQLAASGAWSGFGTSSREPVDLSGVTGPERQTIIDQLAASGITVLGAEPEALPETGEDLTGQDGLKRLDPNEDCRWCSE